MKEILIFAGTTEGRALSEALADAGIAHTVCVATEYGEIVLKEHPLVNVHRGRMDQEEIRHFVEKGNFDTLRIEEIEAELSGEITAQNAENEQA